MGILKTLALIAALAIPTAAYAEDDDIRIYRTIDALFMKVDELIKEIDRLKARVDRLEDTRGLTAEPYPELSAGGAILTRY